MHIRLLVKWRPGLPSPANPGLSDSGYPEQGDLAADLALVAVLGQSDPHVPVLNLLPGTPRPGPKFGCEFQ